MLARISASGRITLPQPVREALNVRPGDQVLFVVEDQTVLVQRLAGISARALAGSLRSYAAGRAVGTARNVVKGEVAGAAAQEG